MLNDVYRLRTFVVAAEEKNFTQTARVLNFSQSAVSQQIRELEDSLDVKLFDRRGRSVALTPAGERLLPLAMGILRDLENVETSLVPYRSQSQGVLRIGATEVPGGYLLPQVLGQFSQACPGVRATLMVGTEAEVERAVQEGALDLLVLEGELPHGRVFGWSREAFMEDELVLIVPPTHPWATRTSVTAQDLREVEIIARRPDQSTRTIASENLAGIGVNSSWMSVRFEIRHTEALKRTVMAGVGSGWISRLTVAYDAEQGDLAIVPVDGLRIVRPLWLLTPEGVALDEGDDQQPAGMGVFRRLLFEAAEKMGAAVQAAPIPSST